MKVTLVIVVAGLALAGAAGAGVFNRASVGVPGRNETEGYSPALWVVLASPATYHVGCCVDSDSGTWKGPRYQATDNPSLGGDSSISWAVSFDPTDRTALAAVKTHLVHRYRVASTVQVHIVHLVGRTKVGTITGTAAITEPPDSNSAQLEGGVGFPLCHGLFAVADFDLLSPYDQLTTGGGRFEVKGTPSKAWNMAQLVASLHGVTLVGPLPVAHVTARSAGDSVLGVVTDCAGHPMPGVTVRAGAHSARTDARGAYRLPGAGVTQVDVSAGGASANARVP